LQESGRTARYFEPLGEKISLVGTRLHRCPIAPFCLAQGPDLEDDVIHGSAMRRNFRLFFFFPRSTRPVIRGGSARPRADERRQPGIMTGRQGPHVSGLGSRPRQGLDPELPGLLPSPLACPLAAWPTGYPIRVRSSPGAWSWPWPVLSSVCLSVRPSVRPS
jgi:hypothetical protein